MVARVLKVRKKQFVREMRRHPPISEPEECWVKIEKRGWVILKKRWLQRVFSFLKVPKCNSVKNSLGWCLFEMCPAKKQEVNYRLLAEKCTHKEVKE